MTEPATETESANGTETEPATRADGGVGGAGGAGTVGGAGPSAAPSPAQARARAAVEQALREAGLPVESPSAGTYVTQLPGTRKLATTCRLVVGAHTLAVSAFVVRHPDENHDAVHRWLLERNLRLYGVAFAVDRLGDVYLSGRLPLAAVTPEEVDRLLGAVLENADGSFNTLLELGFASAIRREYAWRVSRGESTRNLDAFAHLTQPSTPS
ncbi:type III secretion system chaperone family protein [Actinacidiphila yeochonensis]|uniref:YbjN domain-containing protein n=1 Tax=Actinacidiphila yeochonensis TaxID=89050 RepID=UPI000AB53F15